MSGAESTAAAAVVNGEVLRYTVFLGYFAGDMITDWLEKNLGNIGDRIDSVIYEENKIEFCYVALDYEQELKKNPDSLRVSFTKAGAQFLDVDQERFKAPEIMFQPGLIGMTGTVQDLAKSAWEAAPTSAQDELLQNVVLAGGNTLMTGFPERLEKEMK